MANIIFDTETGLVTEGILAYEVKWYEDLGAEMIHLGMERAQSSIVKCYKAGECSVNDVPMGTVAEILAAVGNPPLFEVPED